MQQIGSAMKVLFAEGFRYGLWLVAFLNQLAQRPDVSTFPRTIKKITRISVVRRKQLSPIRVI